MRILISQSSFELLQEEYLSTKVVPITSIIASEKGMRKTYYDLSDGRFSKTKGNLQVWLMDGEYHLTDGYHRFAQYLILGVKKVKIKIFHGYTDYWAKTYPEDQFQVNINSEFGGMEVFADDEILFDLRDEIKMDSEK